MARASVHGHEILELVIHSDPSPTRAELSAIASERFGADARYHTCSADGMSLDELLALLIARSKLAERQGRLEAGPVGICRHGEN